MNTNLVARHCLVTAFALLAVACATRRPALEPRLAARGGGGLSVSVAAFHEEQELDELDVDFDNVPDITLLHTERDRSGVRATFGTDFIGGYVHVFKEEFRAPGLLLTDFDTFGLGGGVVGAPQIAGSERFKVVVPIRYELGLAAGVEEVSGYDLEWIYYQSSLEGGIGLQFSGLQPSVGVVASSVVGLFESDNPASPAHLDAAIVDGLNFGGFAELLYQPDNAPVFGRIRAMFGEVSGVQFSLGVRF